MPNKAFFLDRDGTINIDYDFVHLPEQWDFCPGAVDAIKWMNQNDYKVIVVTNQSGIARGHFTMETVLELHRWVDSQLALVDARIDGWYIAPWHPNFHGDLNPDLLKLRKPNTGMFEQAAAEHDIDFLQSHMAGDKLSDIKPAISLDMQAYLIRSRFTPDWDRDFIKKHAIPEFEHLGELLLHLKQNGF